MLLLVYRYPPNALRAFRGHQIAEPTSSLTSLRLIKIKGVCGSKKLGTNHQ